MVCSFIQNQTKTINKATSALEARKQEDNEFVYYPSFQWSLTITAPKSPLINFRKLWLQQTAFIVFVISKAFRKISNKKTRSMAQIVFHTLLLMHCWYLNLLILLMINGHFCTRAITYSINKTQFRHAADTEAKQSSRFQLRKQCLKNVNVKQLSKCLIPLLDSSQHPQLSCARYMYSTHCIHADYQVACCCSQQLAVDIPSGTNSAYRHASLSD